MDSSNFNGPTICYRMESSIQVPPGSAFPIAVKRTARMADGIKHPVHDFLFEYYSFRPATGALVARHQRLARRSITRRYSLEGIQPDRRRPYPPPGRFSRTSAILPPLDGKIICKRSPTGPHHTIASACTNGRWSIASPRSATRPHRFG